MPRATRTRADRPADQIVVQRDVPAGTNGRAGFNFTYHVRLVCEDMIARLPELRHIDLARVAIGFCQTRKAVAHGMQAALTPLRFENGQRTGLRRGRRYGVQQLVDTDGDEFLYLMTFYLPRFQNQPLNEKLVTILHEMWHISPAFDGDLRRHEGRCYAHTHSEKEYDAAMAVLADRWLAQDPSPRLYEFLRESFASLAARHGGVCGMKIPAPKLLPCD